MQFDLNLNHIIYNGPCQIQSEWEQNQILYNFADREVIFLLYLFDSQMKNMLIIAIYKILIEYKEKLMDEEI